MQNRNSRTYCIYSEIRLFLTLSNLFCSALKYWNHEYSQKTKIHSNFNVIDLCSWHHLQDEKAGSGGGELGVEKRERDLKYQYIIIKYP